MRIGIQVEPSHSFGRSMYGQLITQIRESGWTPVMKDQPCLPWDQVSPDRVDVWVGNVRSREAETALIGSGVPVINYAHAFRTPCLHQVIQDQTAIGRMAARHLLRAGRGSAIALGFPNAPYSEQRVSGFIESLREAGQPAKAIWMRPDGDLHALFAEHRRLLLETGALYCINDTLAARSILALQALGIDVPRSLSVIGTDADEMCNHWLGRDITSVINDYQALAEEIVTLLHELESQPDLPPRLRRVPPLSVFTGETVMLYLGSDPRLVRVAEQVQHEEAERLTVDDLAALAHMSRRNFERHVRRETGRSPGAFLREARMRRAQRLLANPDLSIDLIAERCGYADRNTFSTRFKTETGHSPARFRERLRRIR